MNRIQELTQKIRNSSVSLNKVDFGILNKIDEISVEWSKELVGIIIPFDGCIIHYIDFSVMDVRSLYWSKTDEFCQTLLKTNNWFLKNDEAKKAFKKIQTIFKK